jgi:hypothetical protein
LEIFAVHFMLGGKHDHLLQCWFFVYLLSLFIGQCNFVFTALCSVKQVCQFQGWELLKQEDLGKQCRISSETSCAFFLSVSVIFGSQDCVVAIASGLWNGRSGVRITAGERDFSLLQIVQTSSGAHLATY